jgi:hypothetical protein
MPEESSELTLKNTFQILRESWVRVFLCVIMGGAAATAISY